MSDQRATQPGLDPDRSALGAPAEIGVAVIGDGPFYSDRTCAHIGAEFQTGCARFETVEAALAADLSRLQLLIVRQRLADDLLARPDAYRALNPAATLALAYRDADIARRFYAQAAHDTHGPIGFLPMSAPLEVWLSSLHLLMHREFFLPGDMLSALGDEAARPARADPAVGGARTKPAAAGAAVPRTAPSARLGRLTAREKEVLHLVSAGQSNKHIARKLAITEHTVKLHMHNLSRKLGVPNRTAAASFYLALHQHDPVGRP